MAGRKAKEGVKTENNGYINLKMAGQDSSMMQFKFNRHIPLNKLMKAYYEQQSLSVKQVRFQFDGQPINEADIPAQLEVEFEDTIDMFQQQTGGVYKGNLLFIPELHSHRPSIPSQLENYNLVVLYPDCHHMDFSLLHLPHPHSFIVQSSICTGAHCLFLFNGQLYALINIRWRWDRGKIPIL
ncbi:small ubiquitin-related modifier 2-like [Microcebus murinus]|uniref:small ubiquitin-related modifier 2-like n=1 Tax=Microcebus murinus TaxID=30608 RepID=UPI003F6C3BA3